MTAELPVKSKSKPSRSGKAFENLSNHSKRHNIQTLRDESEVNELVYGTQVKLRKASNQKAAKGVKDITIIPTRGTKYLKSYKSIPSRPQLTPIQALSIFVSIYIEKTVWVH